MKEVRKVEEKIIRVVWKKQCECKGTSTTNKLVLKPPIYDKESIKQIVAFYEMPVCDVCDKPWVEIEEREG